MTFEYVRKSGNITSSRKDVNSCAGPAEHNVLFKVFKDHDLFINAQVDFVHCSNADEIDNSR